MKVIWFLAALAMIVATYSGVRADEGLAPKRIFTKHFNKTLFDITGRADYSIEVLPDDSEYPIGKKVVGVIVHDAQDNDVKGAELKITMKNLATGQYAAGPFTVLDKKNGLYIVSGLDLRKEGRWELSITVKKGGVSDGVKFILPKALKERVPKGRYSP